MACIVANVVVWFQFTYSLEAFQRFPTTDPTEQFSSGDPTTGLTVHQMNEPRYGIGI